MQKIAAIKLSPRFKKLIIAEILCLSASVGLGLALINSEQGHSNQYLITAALLTLITSVICCRKNIMLTVSRINLPNVLNSMIPGISVAGVSMFFFVTTKGMGTDVSQLFLPALLCASLGYATSRLWQSILN